MTRKFILFIHIKGEWVFVFLSSSFSHTLSLSFSFYLFLSLVLQICSIVFVNFGSGLSFIELRYN